MAHRNRVRRHRPDRRPGPPRPAGDLAPRPLVHRGAPALGKRRDVRGRPEPSTHRQRSTGDGHAAEPRHQPAPPGRRHQHRQSPTASRTGHQVPDHTAADQLKCRTRTAPRTLPTPWLQTRAKRRPLTSLRITSSYPSVNNANARTKYTTTCAGSARDLFSRDCVSVRTSSTMNLGIVRVRVPSVTWSVSFPGFPVSIPLIIVEWLVIVDFRSLDVWSGRVGERVE